MTFVILQVLTGLVGLISLWVKEYQSPAAMAKRVEEERNAEIQTGRGDLVTGNVDAVTARIAVVCDSASSGAAGSASDPGATGANLTDSRLRALGISVG